MSVWLTFSLTFTGKGGQNVNKVETDVRAIYLPTGQLVLCTEEQSQHANKQKALSRLKTLHKSEKAIAEAKNKGTVKSYAQNSLQTPAE